ncbi:hypothetical protein cce_3922 [Crocosphaera subtropica ATCC 51142]|uniref:Uncharacterized protein n=2 Tax=Crocosphaera TaxID=263510 RepID=B1WPV5_CROS5|nr:hypothetical protein cce_3922 [Crocosphaera subtropica ATCC 51142]
MLIYTHILDKIMTIAKPSPTIELKTSERINLKLLPWIISTLLKKTDSNYQPTLIGHILLALVLSCTFFGSYALHIHRSAARLNQWLNPSTTVETDVTLQRLESKMAEAQQQLKKTTKPETKHNIERTLSEQERLKTQLYEIDKRLERYRYMMVFFYSRNYASITLTTFSAIIAGSCVLLISRAGWQRINNLVIHLCIFSSGCVILFSDISGIFQYDLNYQNVANIYGEHMTLKNAIRSFFATGGFLQENPNTGETQYIELQDTNRFIYYVDQQLTKFNQIPLAIDNSTLERVVNSANLGDQLGDRISFDVPESAKEIPQ